MHTYGWRLGKEWNALNCLIYHCPPLLVRSIPAAAGWGHSRVVGWEHSRVPSWASPTTSTAPIIRAIQLICGIGRKFHR